MIKSRIQEEPLVREPEVLARFANAPLAERQELLAFREGTDRDGPFFEAIGMEKLRRRSVFI